MVGGSAHSGSRRGILLVNVGSPESPEVPDVRRFLGQFLMDEHVLDVPYVLRRLIVSTVVLPRRPQQSADAYRSIWWDEGSPLVVISRRVQARLQERVDEPVVLGMRYGNPSIEQGIQVLLDRKNPAIEEILVIPLFPHYAMSTTESVVASVRETLAKMKTNVRLEFLPPFCADALYIDALSRRIREYTDGAFDHLLFSYHGLPERHVRKTDPTGGHCLSSPDCCRTPSPAHETCYRHQVLETTERVVEKLGIPRERCSVAFQSRLGREKWLTPSTADEIARLAESGVKRLLVVCPAFVADCLETLEEIGIRGRASFLAAGGQQFELIPCLNDHPDWIAALQAWCDGFEMSAGSGAVVS